MKETIFFIADAFADQYIGGAELTTEAIIEGCGNKQIVKINCTSLTIDFLEKNKNSTFIVCNFDSLEDNLKIYMCKNIKYSIIEYDYKICKYRSLAKHKKITNKECDCLEGMFGKIRTAFYGYAEKIWFMSEEQKDIFLSRVSVLKEEKCEVLSSVFSRGDLRFIQSISQNEKNNKYLILGSDSWIKNTNGCVEYARKNNLDFEIVKDLPYHELLIKMSLSKGLIFHPLAHDTCPRIVIEAKLLGLDLDLNEYVQHKNERWFTGSVENCRSYLDDRASVFWSYYE